MSFAVIVIQKLKFVTKDLCLLHVSPRCWHFCLTFGNIPKCNSALHRLEIRSRNTYIHICLYSIYCLYGQFRFRVVAVRLFGVCFYLATSLIKWICMVICRHCIPLEPILPIQRYVKCLESIKVRYSAVAHCICIEIARYWINWYMSEFLIQSAVLENRNHQESQLKFINMIYYIL